MAEEPREEAWPLPGEALAEAASHMWAATVTPARCSGDISDVSSLGPQDGQKISTSKKRKDPLAIFEAQARCWALDERHGRREEKGGPRESLLKVKMERNGEERLVLVKSA